MVRIRLQRMGRKKRPEYRVVVADKRSPRDGRFIERIGLYYPQVEGDRQLRLDADRAKHWLSVGAQPSNTVRTIFHRAGILEGPAPHLGKPDQPSKADLAAEAKAEADAKAAAEAEAKAAEAEAKAADEAQAKAEAAAAEPAAPAEDEPKAETAEDAGESADVHAE